MAHSHDQSRAARQETRPRVVTNLARVSRSPRASRSARVLVPVFVWLAAATSVSRAHADDAQTQAMGRVLFNDGMALYNQGKYAEACPKFEASLKTYAGLGTRGKLAECYEKVGKFASAVTTYREVARLAATSGDTARERVAIERARALEPKLSSLTIVVPPESDLPGLTIKRDGVIVERSKLGEQQVLDAGTFAFEVTAPNRKLHVAKVAVAVGQAARFEVPVLEKLAIVDAPVEAAHVATTATTTTTSSVMPMPSDDTATWQRPVGLALAGVGAVGLVVGGVFGLSAKSTYDGAFEGGGCDPVSRACNAAGQSTVDTAHSRATTATIFVLAGGVLVGSGLALWVTAPSAKSTGVRVTPTGFASGGGLTISGSM